MARKSFDELDRLTKEAEEKKRKLSEEIKELMRKKNEAHDAAQAAAEAGDTDGYLEKHKAEERLDAEIFVKRTQMDKSKSPVTQDDILSAWEDFSKGYNAEHSREWTKYLNMRKGLYTQFMKVCSMQNDALKLRERCMNLAGETNPAVYKMDMMDTGMVLGLAYKTYQLRNPDVVFFLSTGEAAEDDDALFNDVIRLRKPY